MNFNQAPQRCFLLNYTSRDHFQDRFEIILHAVTESGKPVRIEITNFRPLFFTSRTTPAPYTALAAERKPLELKSMEGTIVDCLYFNTLTQYQECVTRLRSAAYPVYESDVPPVERFLMERFVCGGFEVSGPFVESDNKLFFKNPHIKGGDVTPVFKVLSLDIETNGLSGSIYSIACSGIEDKVFMIGSGTADTAIVWCSDERELLKQFLDYVHTSDPDIIIGWSVIDFDLLTIQNRCEYYSVPFSLGRDSGAKIYNRTTGQSATARVPGRVIMDVPLMLRSYFHTFEEYSLNFVASEMLGKTKIIELTGKEKVAEINHLFTFDKMALAQYNLSDTHLTLEIFEKAGILPNAVERTRRSGRLLDRPGGSVAAFDYLYLPVIHRKGYVAGDITDARRSDAPLPGGYVIEPVPGIYENVIVLDFRSLYPSIIMTFGIDPLAFHVKSGVRIKTPAGTTFSRDYPLLPEIIDRLMGARAAAKKDNNPHLSQAIKILMNSFYGVLGSQGCRFFNPEIATTITRTGQYILKETIRRIPEISPYRVLYGDTDSLFVLLGPGNDQSANDTGKQLASQLTQTLAEHLSEHYAVDSRLHLEYQDHFRHFLLPPVRGATHGSKKHYCGSILENGETRLVFKGMESARSDWTDLAKEFQQELILKVFRDEPVDDYIRETVSLVEMKKLDDKLIYKKRLRKDLMEYTVNVPPHVQAAKLLDTIPHTVRYIITVNGPQPVEKISAPIDYSHYIDAQLRPIADTILPLKGKDFDSIISGQMSLF
ncbi:MAG TPA: DNA polymerase II [Chitinispirillaceae bacterium]|nr:DNA polymerase II [Chitinispirillaceae bacterium]